ncbi:hypothetical protein ACA29_23020 [Lederbergia galactosidilytica]|uniref:Uncharacterized protein n=1 Tax=Lederbergia galactosidilytica TaxID=217031 RepID=A0A0Q9XLW6_9BACI|nr:hypothetical protein ACA29_23020 [Lederbergia galactosidilytica]
MQKITFGKGLAKTIGLNESIVLEKLYERIEKEGTPLHGQMWIERTYKEWLARRFSILVNHNN